MKTLYRINIVGRGELWFDEKLRLIESFICSDFRNNYQSIIEALGCKLVSIDIIPTMEDILKIRNFNELSYSMELLSLFRDRIVQEIENA